MYKSKQAFSALAIMGLLLVGSVFAAQSKSTKPAKATTHEASGTVVSVNATSLVISHKVKGKDEQMTFVLNPETKREGKLDVGSHATVKYRSENNEHVATMVKGTAAKHS
jgi:hypothetical protein